MVSVVVLLCQVNKDRDMLYPDKMYCLNKCEEPFFVRQRLWHHRSSPRSLQQCLSEEKLTRGFTMDSFLDNFVSRYRNATPTERVDYLYEDVIVERNH